MIARSAPWFYSSAVAVLLGSAGCSGQIAASSDGNGAADATTPLDDASTSAPPSSAGGGGTASNGDASASGPDAHGGGGGDGAANGCSYDASGGTGGSVATGGDAGQPADVLVSIAPAGTSVELYHPLTIAVVTSEAFANGFDPDEVALDVEVTGPCGEAIVQPCFFKSAANGKASWECRFAPRHAGEHRYRVLLREPGGVATSASYPLTASPTSSDGFLHADTAHAVAPNVSSAYGFRFDSGKIWRGVGEDVAWEIEPYTFQVAIPRLHADGLNMTRIWHSSFSLPVEWGAAPGHYDSGSADTFDKILQLAAQNGVYVMVMMNDYREFDENWGKNPYNVANGGWCNAPGEFFSNADAKAAYKKKLRYYVARWGSSTAIQSFEFFNEIDNAMNAQSSIHAADVATWVGEMSAYLHASDPSGHLVTASVSYVNLKFWAASGIDFTQSHLYGQNNRITNLPSHIESYVSSFEKPYVCGEFSRRWETATTEPSGNYRQELHYGMWLGMVQATPILPMAWWWDSHWKWGDDFVFKSVAGFSNDLLTKAGSGTVTSLETSASGGLESGGLVTGNTGYVWVSNYNPGNGTASSVTLKVAGLRTGSNPYTVEAYDTWNGGFASPTAATSQNGTLTINVGTLTTSSTGSDAAYRIVDVNGP